MLCSKCKRQTKRFIIGKTVRQLCINRTCTLHGVPQGEALPIPEKQDQDQDATTVAVST